MKILFFILLSFPIIVHSQNLKKSSSKESPDTGIKKIEKNQIHSSSESFTQLELNTILYKAELKEKQQKLNQIYLKYVGALPQDLNYSEKKNLLHSSQPEKYEQMVKELDELKGVKGSKRRLSREKYNSLPKDKQLEIDNNPNLYEITN